MLAPEAITTPTWIPVITPIVTLLIGFATSQFADLVKDHRTYRRERETRTEVRNDAKRERHNAFQRETLLNLQDAALDVIRIHYQLHSFDVSLVKRQVQRHSEPYPAEIDEAAMLANAKTALLRVRIADDEVRQLVHQMKERCTSAILKSVSFDDAVAQMSEADRIFTALNERIGLILRKLDAEDASTTA